MERRTLSLPALPVRLEKRADGAEVLRGYAAVFYRSDDPGTQYQLYEDLAERVMPGCFDRCLRDGQDVVGLFNHDEDFVLGRRSAGTMTLSVDDKGLLYEINPPSTVMAKDVVEMVRRGDVRGSSFSFAVRKQMWGRADAGMDYRELHDVDVFDVGPVTFPAYESTTSGLRAAELPAEVRSAWDNWRAERANAAAPATVVAVVPVELLRMRQRLAEAG